MAKHQHKFTVLFLLNDLYCPWNASWKCQVSAAYGCAEKWYCPARGLPCLPGHISQSFKIQTFSCWKTTHPVREWGTSYHLLGAKWQSAEIFSLWHLQSNLCSFLQRKVASNSWCLPQEKGQHVRSVLRVQVLDSVTTAHSQSPIQGLLNSHRMLSGALG